MKMLIFVKMLKNLKLTAHSYVTCFRTAMLKHSVRLPKFNLNFFQFKYIEFQTNEQTFNVGRAYNVLLSVD